MNYDYIEDLVRKSKDGDEVSKEKLIEEFRPFIFNLSKRTFIPGYDFDDFKNECYRILPLLILYILILCLLYPDLRYKSDYWAYNISIS